jgi:hypothetical protein
LEAVVGWFDGFCKFYLSYGLNYVARVEGEQRIITKSPAFRKLHAGYAVYAGYLVFRRIHDYCYRKRLDFEQSIYLTRYSFVLFD